SPSPAELAQAPGPAVRVPIFFTLALGAVFFGGCGRESVPGPEGASPDRSELPDPTTFSREASSELGMVVSGNPYASHAGAEMLEAGGNAVDAAVATAFALGVVEPSQSGIGGRTQALVGLPDGSFFGIDGTTQVPLGYDAQTAPRVERGYPTVAIPGTVKALTRLLSEFGSLPLERVLAPAIRYAEGGALLTEGEARRIAAVAEGLREYEWASRSFLKPDGSPYAGGDTLVQPDLAETLRRLAREGPGVFYEGDLARRMADDIQGHGGFVTMEDLRHYEARDAILARGSYRGRELVGTYLPASGATVIEILHILENFPLGAMSEPERAAVLSQALLLGFEDRDDSQFDPPEEVVTRLTSKAWAAGRAQEIQGAREDGSPEEWPHTTHVSVADRNGMVVAMTQSLGPTLGSWVVTPGLGFVYAATTGGYLADAPPGGRPWSSQAPLIILEDGSPRYVLGGAGARRIVSALVSVVSRLLDQGMGLSEALAASRLHPSGGGVTLEDGAEPEPGAGASLEGVGFRVDTRPFSTWFALLNAIEIEGRSEGEGREFLGVADPRWAWGGAVGPGERD
ncbi:MAG: gamma-glutamyltransferase family protein, partial [Longimicrobiales bacterium]